MRGRAGRGLGAGPDAELIEGAAPVGVAGPAERAGILAAADGEGGDGDVGDVGGGGGGGESLGGGEQAVEEEADRIVLIDGRDVRPYAGLDGARACCELPQASVLTSARAGDRQAAVGGVGTRILAAAVEQIPARGRRRADC